MSFTSNPAFSGNPDKEAMQAARRALRDQAIRELAHAEQFGNDTTSYISKLRVKVSQLRHACAKSFSKICVRSRWGLRWSSFLTFVRAKIIPNLVGSYCSRGR